MSRVDSHLHRGNTFHPHKLSQQQLGRSKTPPDPGPCVCVAYALRVVEALGRAQDGEVRQTADYGTASGRRPRLWMSRPLML